jgi:hypothetical protein
MKRNKQQSDDDSSDLHSLLASQFAGMACCLRQGGRMLVLLVWFALMFYSLATAQSQPEMPLATEATPDLLQRSVGKALLDSPSRRQRAAASAAFAELRQAEDWLSSNQAPRALAFLADVLRKDPSNHLAVERLLAVLSQRNFPRLLEVTNAPAQPATNVTSPWKSPDGHRELRRLPDGSGQLYDVRTGQPAGVPLIHGKGITAAWFSPDGLRVATTSNPDCSACIWDATTGLPLSPLLKHRSYVNSARFSPDGLLLVTGSCDSTARVWDGFTGTPRSESMKVGAGIVWAAEFSLDGRRVTATTYERATRLCYVFEVLPGLGSWDRVEAGKTNHTVRFWDAITGQTLDPEVLSNLTSGTALRDAKTGRPLDLVASTGTASSARFTPDGRRVIVFQLPPCVVPVPAWVPELAEAVAGVRMNEKRVPTNVPWADRLKTLSQLAGVPATDDCTSWLEWFLADRSTRLISPMSSLTVPAYVQRRIDENTLASLQEAVRLAPTNGLAFARLARQVLAQSETDNPRRVGEADFFSRHAVKLAPQDAEVAKLRSEIGDQIKTLPKP